MATYSSAPSVSAAIKISKGFLGIEPAWDLYTCPANSYAYIKVYSTNPVDLHLDNLAGHIVGRSNPSDDAYIMVGPGQTVYAPSNAVNLYKISGVQFTNGV